MNFLLIVFLMLGQAVFVSAEEAAPKEEAAAESTAPQQQFEGFNLQGYDDTGEKSWDVNGDTADVMGSTIKINNVNANAYGEQNVNVKAKTGTVDQTSGNMHLEKDVVITTDKGTQLKTESLDWQRNNDLVKTEDLVTITDKDMIAIGTGATAHPNLKEAQLNEDVTVKVKGQSKESGGDGQPVTITCDGPMVVDQIKQMATFHDNVVAIQDGRTLKADKMEIYFDTISKKIRQTICLGNVSIIQGENTTHSEKAVYDSVSQTLTLSGQPKLILMTEGDNPIAAFPE